MSARIFPFPATRYVRQLEQTSAPVVDFEHLDRTTSHKIKSCGRCLAPSFTILTNGKIYCAECDVRIDLTLASSRPVGGGGGESAA